MTITLVDDFVNTAKLLFLQSSHKYI